MELSKRVIEAFGLAFELHRTQRRKGSGVPYITHLMAVAAAVGDHGGDEDQIVAALLHDAVEDQGGKETLARIEDAFGREVADLVAGCTDSLVSPKPPWRDRKQSFAQSLRTASPRVKLIVAADKLHNIRTTINDLRTVGSAVWRRFAGGRDGTLWYYREVCRALAHRWSDPVLEELLEAADMLRQAAQGPETKG